MADVQLSSHPVDIGLRSETTILAALVELGYDVLVPWGFNRRYDYVIDLGREVIRAQCKTGRLRDGLVLFPTMSVRVNTQGAHRRSYRGEVDVFLVHCPQTKGTYVVPVVASGPQTGQLRVSPTRNGQAKRIRWARDHLIAEGSVARALLPPR
ncbi:MAG TPA: group I intron-associated PD-(D/E)XK endonuclease [Solirubrobacteraceae bacterium]|nr:group I intron-associated PD-(D/E)XK endonuclease [Solirubrobacteraceae bacterium]